MKKTLIIILSLLLVIVAVVGLYINNTRKLVKYAEKNNKEYENFYQQEILGTTLISIINKAINDNEKNGVNGALCCNSACRKYAGICHGYGR